MKNFSSDTAKGYATIGIALLVIIVLIIAVKKFFGGLDEFLESFGLKDSKDEKEVKEAIKDAEEQATQNPTVSPWNPLMYKKAPGGTQLVTVAIADKAAKQIYNSSGYFLPDRPEEAFAAIKTMPNQAAVSFLSERFELLYQTDLLAWLTESFNDTPTQLKTFSQIVTYVKNLKKY